MSGINSNSVLVSVLIFIHLYTHFELQILFGLVTQNDLWSIFQLKNTQNGSRDN